jgi:hypothetical protein
MRCRECFVQLGFVWPIIAWFRGLECPNCRRIDDEDKRNKAAIADATAYYAKKHKEFDALVEAYRAMKKHGFMSDRWAAFRAKAHLN